MEGDELEQGDIIEGCPISVAAETETADGRWKLQWEERDLIVLSQSCDLVKGREKVSEVLMAAVWKQSELSGHLATIKEPGGRSARQLAGRAFVGSQRLRRNRLINPRRRFPSSLRTAADISAHASSDPTASSAPAATISRTPVSSLRPLLHASWPAC